MGDFEQTVINVMNIAADAEIRGLTREFGEWAKWEALSHNLFAAIVAAADGVISEERLTELADLADEAAA